MQRMEETPPRMRDAVETGTPGDFVFFTNTVYQVQADGSWRALEPALAAKVREERGK